MMRPFAALALLLAAPGWALSAEPPEAAAQPAAPDPAAVLAKAGPAVARLYSRGQAGMAVVFKDRGHMITARSLVLFGRPVQLRFADGTTLTGRPLRGEADSEFAVIRLEGEAPAAPLPLETTTPNVGEALVVVGRGPGLVDEHPAAAAGRVASGDEDLFHLATTVGSGPVGTPVIDGQGRLRGILLESDGGAWRPVLPAAAFAAAKPGASVDRGQVLLTMQSGLMLGVSTDRTMNTGLYSGFRVIAWDQLQLDARVGLLFDSGLPPGDDALIAREKFGLFVDALAGYRINLGPPDVGPLQLTIAAGVTVQQHGGQTRALNAAGATEKTPIEEVFTRPAAQLSLRVLDVLDLNYTWDINPDDLGASSHRFGFGFGL